MEPASEQRKVEGRSWWCLLVRGAPLASYGLVAHFPSCSPVVVVVVVAHVFEQRLTRLAYVLVRVCLRVRCLSAAPSLSDDEELVEEPVTARRWTSSSSSERLDQPHFCSQILRLRWQ